MTLVEQVEKTQGLQNFIKEFLLQLGRTPEIQKSNFLTSEFARQQLIARVSKILDTETELQIDEELLNNMPVNSEDPQFLASEVFRDTLLGFGVDEETANNARKTFLAIKKDKFEETQESFYKMAAKLHSEASEDSKEHIQRPSNNEFSFMQKVEGEGNVSADEINKLNKSMEV